MEISRRCRGKVLGALLGGLFWGSGAFGVKYDLPAVWDAGDLDFQEFATTYGVSDYLGLAALDQTKLQSIFPDNTGAFALESILFDLKIAGNNSLGQLSYMRALSSFDHQLIANQSWLLSGVPGACLTSELF
jgi:hypothetical protein